MAPTHVFSGNPLDRASERRSDQTWLDDRLRNPVTRIIPLWQLKPLLSTGGAPGAVWLPPEAVLP
ncbi:MAG: NADH pyrophosphatase, partial [Proteobacteria bacterium]|nr:NADH pyrophosphatase [Pseudomonadota bacterium]